MKFLNILKENVHWLVLLLLLQAVFSFAIISVQLVYQPKIMDNLITIMDYLKEAGENVDGLPVLGQKTVEVYQNYINIKGYLMWIIIYSVLVWIILNNLNWFFSVSLLKKKVKKIYLLKFAVFSVIVGGLIYLLSYLPLKSALLDLIDGVMPLFKLIVGFVFLILLIYFMFIFYAYLDQKNFIKKSLLVGLNKFYIIIPLYLLILLMFSFGFYLVYLSVKKGVLFSFFSIVFTLVAFLIMRLYFIYVLNNKKSFSL